MIEEFKGRRHEPTRSEIDLAFHVNDYCQSYFGLKPKMLYEMEHGLTKTGFDALKARRTSKHYEALVVSLYTFLAAMNSDKTYLRLDQVHGWMYEPLCQLFPEFRMFFRGGTPLYHERLTAAATKDEDARARVTECFGGERYIYRYARNEDDKEVRIAKGRLTVPNEIRSETFLPFKVEYRAAPRRKGGVTTESLISGNILVIKSHFMFFGVEDGRKDAFVMVIRDDGPHETYGALILRKHLERGFMATKGLVMSPTAISAKIGAFAVSEIPELNPDFQELLVNIGKHKGLGPLTLPEV